MKRFVCCFFGFLLLITGIPTASAAQKHAKVAYIGQTVRVGSVLLQVPQNSPHAPIIRYGNNNVFFYQNYLFIEVDMKNVSKYVLGIDADMFRLTWSAEGGGTHYYVPDMPESYNLDTNTYKNSKYYFALPTAHLIRPKESQKMGLAFDIPTDMSRNESGIIGLSTNIDPQHPQLFELIKLN